MRRHLIYLPLADTTRNYTKVPINLKTDNVIPPVSEIPSIWTSFRHPRKTRSVSVGPQSVADAYEVLAYREKRRRESSSLATAAAQTKEQEYRQSYPFGRFTSNSFVHKPLSTGLPTPAPSGADLYNDVFGSQAILDVPMTPNTLQSSSSTPDRRASDDQRQFDSEEKEMFSKLEKPRVRYDVEVVTKLIVYTGKSCLNLQYLC